MGINNLYMTVMIVLPASAHLLSTIFPCLTFVVINPYFGFSYHDIIYTSFATKIELLLLCISKF